MNTLAFDIALLALALGLFAGCFAVALVLTRPERPDAAPASPELGAEPPAVVNLIAGGWRLNEDAVEATLLDLAARRHLELRQPGADPRQTTVHLRDSADAAPGELYDYERRVLDRVRGLAVGGVVPISALTFRDTGQHRGWAKRFNSQVIAEAHARGLSRRRFDAPVITLLEIVAGISALGVTAAFLHWESWAAVSDDDRGAWLIAGIMTFMLLSGAVATVTGERHTEAGLAAAGRWLGVRGWLRGHEQFADLPPASVMVWDRYLAYGAALGVTHVTSEVLDLGMADRTLVWSSHGGHWHRVRVRYPKWGARYGRPSSKVLFGALIGIAVGTALLWVRSELWRELDLVDLVGPEVFDSGIETTRLHEIVALVLLLAGSAMVIRGGYWLLRGIVDLATTRTVSGEVLWLELWRSESRNEGSSRVPTLYYLAVDDGSAERTTAWALPTALNIGVGAGDSVTVRVRPWTRLVLSLTVTGRGSHSRLAEPLDEERGEPQRRLVPSVDANTLLTAEEVGTALGMPISAAPPVPTPVMSMATFYDDRGKPVLLVQCVAGTAARWAWRAHAKRGTALSGIGDDARDHGKQVAARIGDRIVVLVLMRQGSERVLPELLRRATGRLAGTTPSPDIRA